jgi:hypothetical protein
LWDSAVQSHKRISTQRQPTTNAPKPQQIHGPKHLHDGQFYPYLRYGIAIEFTAPKIRKFRSTFSVRLQNRNDEIGGRGKEEDTRDMEYGVTGNLGLIMDFDVE